MSIDTAPCAPRIAIGGILHETSHFHGAKDDTGGLRGTVVAFRRRLNHIHVCFAHWDRRHDRPGERILLEASADYIRRCHARWRRLRGRLSRSTWRDDRSTGAATAGRWRVTGFGMALWWRRASWTQRPIFWLSCGAIVGDAVPIVVLLDMHGNISPRLVGLADVLLAYNTNPHSDGYARGKEAADIMARLLSGEVRPTAAYARPACCFCLPKVQAQKHAPQAGS